MRERIERQIDGLAEREQKILLGVLVERLLKTETEEIVFEDAQGQPIGYFLPHELRMDLDRARLIAELEHPDGLPPLEDVVAATAVERAD